MPDGTAGWWARAWRRVAPAAERADQPDPLQGEHRLPFRRGLAHDPARRRALGRAGRILLSLLAGAGLFRAALATAARAAAGLQGLLARIRGLPPVITPVKDHYIVSKNFTDPNVDGDRWRLKIHGLVDHPLELNLGNLKALPSVERSTTLICISNEVGGKLVGNSLWTGVPLQDLLTIAGARSGATHVILRAADDYSDSFPIDIARREGTMVAYLQNGAPLERAHGFPARVLAPGLYGMKNVKWLVEIELVDHDYQGYWQRAGWSQEAVVHTMSRIDTRTATRLSEHSAAIGGIAFAGVRGVKAVELTLDFGKTWHRATLRPADTPYSWTLWGFEWPVEPGHYDFLVRAIDGEGNVQTSKHSPPLPDGATGYDALRVWIR